MKKLFPQTSYNLHAIRVLEFDSVREIVASFANSEEGHSHLISLIPYASAKDVKGLLAEVDEFMQAVRFDDLLPEMSMHPISALLPMLKIKGYNLGIEKIASMADNLEIARLTMNYFKNRPEKYPILWGIAGAINSHEEIEKLIRKVITPDLTIADDASPELRKIRRRLLRARSALRDIVEKTLSELPDEVVAERLVTIRNNRFVLPIHNSMKKRVQGAVHDRSQTGKTLFIEPLVSIDANNLVCELEMAEHAEIEKILVELTGSLASVSDDIEHNQELLVRMDVIKAKASFGVGLNGVIPVINDEPELSIKKGRHPLLEWKYRKQKDGLSVVPMNLDIGYSTITIVITGPNAGGKTVALKTAGLLTIMALSGLPVPAANGTAVYVPSGFFADIGDEQSIENDLSTFSSHMRQIVTIMRKAGPGALVLLDELGGGTNPADGEAIALAVLKKLTRSGAMTIATTHHNGLKVYAHETEKVTNASMEFDNTNLRPTYVLRTGIPGSSYAFEIAGRLGMPKNVLRDAESFAGGERKTLEGLIAEMEEHVLRADSERQAAKLEHSGLEKSRKKLEQQLEELTNKRQEILDNALAESQKIVQDVNQRIETAIKTIREKNASHEAILEAKSLVKKTTEDIKKAASRIPQKTRKKKGKPVKKLRENMPVWVNMLGMDAVVEKVLDNGGKARIRVGKSKAALVVNVSELSEGDALHSKDKQIVTINVSSEKVSSFEIDLRGMTFDEARYALDIFFDRLHVAGMEKAHIIHGKGTGALRTKIGKYLDKHSYVDSHRLGNWNEGSSGVTVVTLKK